MVKRGGEGVKRGVKRGVPPRSILCRAERLKMKCSGREDDGGAGEGVESVAGVEGEGGAGEADEV